MKKIFTLAIIALLAIDIFASTSGRQADSAYNKEDYREAINLYQQSIDNDGKSSTVYYNLANAYYRNDNLGKAILNYERALRLDPTNDDARQNLDFVRSRIQDRPEDDTSFFTRLHRSTASAFAPDTWAWLAFGLFLALAGAIALYIFSQNIILRKAGFFGGIALLCIFAYVLYVASYAVSVAKSHDTAIVTAPSTQLSSAPRAARTTSDKVVTIHEGTKVEIVDSVATPDDPVSPKWYNVKINNSTKAWLRSSDVERI